MKINIKSKRFFSKAILVVSCLTLQMMAFAQRDIYLVIGQSNAAGRADIETQDMVSLTGVDLYNGTTWESANNIDPATNNGDGGMNRYSTIRNTAQTQGLSFSYNFAKMVEENTGTQIGLVVNARGGTSIDDWAATATAGYYTSALTQVNAALALGGSTLKGILWHQGESDRNDASYITKLTAIISAFRTDLTMPNLPFFAGELSQQRTDNGNFNSNIRNITDSNDPAYIASTEVVSTAGLNTSDRTHFNSNGQRVLGYRYAAKVLEMIYGFTYVQDQIMYVEKDAYIRGGNNATTAQHPLEIDLLRVKEVASNLNNTRRSLLQFDMSTIANTPNLKIVDASLLMTGNADVDNGPIDISFYDINTTWTEASVTFSNAPAFTNQLTASTTTFAIDENDDDNDGDSDELVHGGADITEFFKTEYDLGTTNISLGLKSETDGSPQFKFSPKEDVANFASRPYIVVSYLVNTACTPATGTDVQTACETFDWIDGVTYTSSNNTATFTIVGGAASGCDSIVTLDLTINNPTTGTDVQTACETFDWIDGVTYTSSNNTATFTIVGGAASGCDSIVTLDLTINNTTTGTDVQTACESFTWIDGMDYTANNNTATFTIVGGAASGCDSIVTLDLTINTVNTSTSVSELTITADLAGATYQWIDCGNGDMPISGETNQSFTATANGDYAVIVTENNCSDTSDCVTISTVSVTEFDAQTTITVFPNPSSEIFTIESDLLASAKSISVVSILGKQIYNSNNINSKSYSLDCSKWTPGVYVLNIETELGNKTLRLIKK